MTSSTIRGVRQTLPSGSLVGRLSGAGSAQPITIAAVAQAVQNVGGLATQKHVAAAISAASKAGVTDGSNAAAGDIGEYIISTVASGSAVALTSGSPTNITSITLTAGDWDVTGLVQTVPGAGTAMSLMFAAASLYSATVPSAWSLEYPVAASAAPTGLVVPTIRISISTPVSIYLVVAATFSGGTLTGFGYVAARRMR